MNRGVGVEGVLAASLTYDKKHTAQRCWPAELTAPVLGRFPHQWVAHWSREAGASYQAPSSVRAGCGLLGTGTISIVDPQAGYFRCSPLHPKDMQRNHPRGWG